MTRSRKVLWSFIFFRQTLSQFLSDRLWIWSYCLTCRLTKPNFRPGTSLLSTWTYKDKNWHYKAFVVKLVRRLQCSIVPRNHISFSSSWRVCSFGNLAEKPHLATLDSIFINGNAYDQLNGCWLIYGFLNLCSPRSRIVRRRIAQKLLLGKRYVRSTVVNFPQIFRNGDPRIWDWYFRKARGEAYWCWKFDGAAVKRSENQSPHNPQAT